MTNTSLLKFHIGPVQTFIESARTVRDLWTGSYLLSWLVVAAMKPVRERIRDRNDCAFVSPDVTENVQIKLFDAQDPLALKEGERIQATIPCFPNHFEAEVPAGESEELANACIKACQAEWQEIAGHVHERIQGSFSRECRGDWAHYWKPQIDHFFEIHCVTVPIADVTDAKLKELLPEIRNDFAGQMTLLHSLMDSVRGVKHVPEYSALTNPQPPVPMKCSLLGSFEQMGPAQLGESKTYWENLARLFEVNGTGIGKTERLCAVSLVKRFAWPIYFSAPTEKRGGEAGGRLGLNPTKLRFSDTATVAAAVWLRTGVKISPQEIREESKSKYWSGQWLHWPSQEPDSEDKSEVRCPDHVWNKIQAKKKPAAQGKPPTYYAILMMDGDRMGKILAGEVGPEHWSIDPRERISQISKTLGSFALKEVRQLVNEHDGELIYAGGDDVLAILPTQTAIGCARKVQERYQSKEYMGGMSTLSAGVAVVHYKEDLRFALQQAREAEKMAKNSGRDALGVTVCRRSGEHSSAIIGWDQTKDLQRLLEHFLAKASDRWAYKLRGELPVLCGLGWEPFRAELCRLLTRVESLTQVDEQTFEESVTSFFDDYQTEMTRTNKDTGESIRNRKFAVIVTDFVTLCQSASFLARGRDQ